MNAYRWGVALILLGLVLTLTLGLTFASGTPWLLIGPAIALVGLAISAIYLVFGERVEPHAPRAWQRRGGRHM